MSQPGTRGSGLAIGEVPAERRLDLARRWDRAAARLAPLLERLYPGQPEVLEQLRQITCAAAAARPERLWQADRRWLERPGALLAQGALPAPGALLAPGALGYSCYVDRFAGTLRGVIERIPYLRDLGVTYLHLLPFWRAREGDNDGGFAISDFEQVAPHLGSNADLDALALALEAAGITLCADFVLNHTADDHPWALAARAGDAAARACYLIFPDRTVPDAHEQSLGQVFPATAPGNFTHVPEAGGWVWTTFYPYQWDLNYANPAVLLAILATLLRLANRGIGAFRLDSAAFLWKRRGTACVNLPEAHDVLRILRAAMEVAAPSVMLKAEVIMPLDDVLPYLGDAGPDGAQCHLAYHSALMTATWAALALGDAQLPARVIARTPPLPPGTAWVNYLRCHDDIGWAVLRPELPPERAGAVLAAIDACYHAGTGFGRGQAFQQAGSAGTMHGTNGMLSALVGLDTAGDPHGLLRLEAMFALLLACGGLPLLYMGDEIGLANNWAYADAADQRHEGRWLHRPAMDWAAAARRHDPASRAGQVWAVLQRQLARWRALPAAAHAASVQAEPAGSPAVLLLTRGAHARIAINLSDQEQSLDPALGLPATTLGPYAVLWHSSEG